MVQVGRQREDVMRSLRNVIYQSNDASVFFHWLIHLHPLHLQILYSVELHDRIDHRKSISHHHYYHYRHVLMKIELSLLKVMHELDDVVGRNYWFHVWLGGLSTVGLGSKNGFHVIMLVE